MILSWQPRFRARVAVRTPEQGGRAHPINWGYRPDLVFEADRSQFYGAGFVSEEKSDSWAIAPGETREIDFYIRVPEAAARVVPRLQIGSAFTMNEGHRAVADCVITHIYCLDD
jgi:hypothetical protein